MSINLLNISRPFEVNSSIIEWDIKRAGLNLIKEKSLLSKDDIDNLEKLSKKDADIKIGKMQINDKVFSKNLEQAFTDIMNTFLIKNNLDKDFDVLSIKKDACFVINKNITNSSFGNFITFVPKNEYHAYIYLKPFEIFFKRNGDIDIKNFIGDKKRRNKILDLHQNGILNLFQFIIYIAETSTNYQKDLNKFLHEFVEMYKRKELEFDYYREFNVESRFRYQSMGGEIMMDHINTSILEKINIEYNYIHIILPLINLLC